VLWPHIAFGITSAHLPFSRLRGYLDCFKYQSVSSFHCTVELWVVDKSEGYLHPNLMAKIIKHVIVKLFGIVNGDFSWHTEAADVVL
jgi:hypothetical protein